MLTITFINDGSGTEIEGNYRFKVEINGRKISEGVMLGHNNAEVLHSPSETGDLWYIKTEYEDTVGINP